MKSALRPLLVVLLLLVTLVQPAEAALTLPLSASAAPLDKVYFAATGHSVQGKFLQYWQTHGGLEIFGYPVTPEFYEQGYLVQYFERNRFELHPEKAGTPYEVLLGLLGSQRLTAEGRLPFQANGQKAAPGAQFFPETGFSLGGRFLSYWKKYGGLAQFGFPITPEIQENGRTVQYLERARFELHPENAGTIYEVLLGLLGNDLANTLDPVLRERWAENPVQANLRLDGASQPVTPLTPLTVTSDVTGEVLVLGSDNHQYTSLKVAAGISATFYAAGAPGWQGLLLYRDGQVIAARWNSFQVSAPQPGISTGDPVWDGLYPRVKGFLEKDVVTYYSPLDNSPVRGYRSPDTPFIWLRDHVYQSKGFKFFEKDLKSTLDYFRASQHPDGSFDDYFLHFPGYAVYKDQIQVEADREFLYVEGVWAAWQATGDDGWLRASLGAMERGLEYTFTDPHRWSKELGLVKRPFTIDTWDFEQGSNGLNIRRYFDSQTRWGIMHGDNTGAYHAARLLAQVERYFGRTAQAALWDSRADMLLQNLNKLAWNGQFYTHQIHLTPVDPTGVDEKTQLSLSNAYALNRGTLSQSQAASLLRTYQARQAQNSSRIFAEWYSIDPPFPQGFGTPGEYINGGVMPLVGGELARGAFENGFEAYGIDILWRYWQLLDRSGGSYLWYHPDGRPGVGTDVTLATDGWGSSAMLNALVEGLAGLVDNGKLYQNITLAPRWAATGRPAAQVTLAYGASGAYFTYNWQRHPDNSLSLVWGGAQTQTVRLHLLLPSGFTPRQVFLNNTSIPFSLSKIEKSNYLDVILPGNGQLEIN